MRPGQKRRLKWAALALVIGVIAFVTTGWLMFQHIPSWYRPPAIASQDHQRHKNDLLGMMDTIAGKLANEKAPFRLRITQTQINAWLAIHETLWPGADNWLPEYLANPFVKIDSDGIRLAATYKRGELQTVLSVHLELQATPESIHLRLLDVAGGALGVPRSWIKPELEALDGTVWPAGKRARDQIDGPPLPEPGRLFEGVDLPNAWIWNNWIVPDSGQPFRITDIRLEPGAIVATLQALPRHRPRR